MPRTHGRLDSEDTNEAAWIATRGAVTGAARWGLYSAMLAAAGFAFSPIYRGLTFQFKVFLQMSGMTLGSILEADRRLREHGADVRKQTKMARDAAVWRRYEAEFEQRGTPGVSSEASAGQKSDVIERPKGE